MVVHISSVYKYIALKYREQAILRQKDLNNEWYIK